MSGRVLTVDLGNSICKLGVWQGRELLGGASFEADETLPERVEIWLAELAELPSRGALCAVADPGLEHALTAAVRRRVPAFDDAPDPGVVNACQYPETVGRDRLFAARGAWALVGRTAVVVDVGTALTVDLVESATPRPIFRGGAIAPGPALLARALSSGGARLPDFAPRPGARALGRHTREALEAGVAVGLRGAARELVASIRREANAEDAPVVVTGGALPFLAGGAPLADEVVESPSLVQLGLLAAVDDAGGAGR